jgi:hypothetical protein
MRCLLLIAGDMKAAAEMIATLRRAGYEVLRASQQEDRDAKLCELQGANIILFDPFCTGASWIINHDFQVASATLIASSSDVARADVGSLPVGIVGPSSLSINGQDTADLVASTPKPRHARSQRLSSVSDEHDEPYALTRWARALAPVIYAPRDPRTIAQWSHLAFSSVGALRNWCRTAGIAPRRSLVCGRLLRAVVLNEQQRQRPENLLDVVDKRTLRGLLQLAGFDGDNNFPANANEFLDRQKLIQDPHALRELRRVIDVGATTLRVIRQMD